MKKLYFVFLLTFALILSACGDDTSQSSDSNGEQDPTKILADIREGTSDSQAISPQEENSANDDKVSLEEAKNTSGDNVQAPIENTENNSVDTPQVSDSISEPVQIENEENKTESDGEVMGQDRPDIDLTVLSSTVMYSELYNILTQPDNFEGKTIRIRGQFSAMEDPKTGKRYFACGISDVGGCCQIGLEFETSEELVFPDEYPALGAIVTIEGTYHSYTEDGIGYRTLLNSTMTN